MVNKINVALGFLAVLSLALIIYIIIDKTVLSHDCPSCPSNSNCPPCQPISNFTPGPLATDVTNIYNQFSTVDQTITAIENGTQDKNTKCNNFNNIANVVNNRRNIAVNMISKIVEDRIKNVNAAKQRLGC